MEAITGLRSAADFFDIGALDSGDIRVHVFVHGLQLVGVLLQFHELLFEIVEVVHGVSEGVDHRPGGA